MERVDIKTFEQFIEFVHKGRPECAHIYRGQPLTYTTAKGVNRETQLLPSLYRQILRPAVEVSVFEKKLLADFKSEAIPYLGYAPKSQIEWMALAQHYRLPTRLLDWTFNPLVALFFAVEYENQDCDSCIYQGHVDNSQLYDREEGVEVPDAEIFRLYRPPHFDTRIQVQASCFTLHKSLSDTDPDVVKEYGEQVEQKLRFRRGIIPRTQFLNIKWELYKFGVTYGSLFPDIEGIGRSITWRNLNDSLLAQGLNRDVFSP